MEQRFLALCDGYFEQYLGRIRSCVDRLDESQVWWRPHEACNSVGNLLLHLCGNLTQWVLCGLGGQEVERHRAAEFAAREGAPKDELLKRLAGVVDDVRAVLAVLEPSDLAAPREVQGYAVDGTGVVLHVVEHMSYHTGQIVAAAKQMLGPSAGIEFYPQHRNE
jgi:uncharacterized damage-inducible protein DinB